MRDCDIEFTWPQMYKNSFHISLQNLRDFVSHSDLTACKIQGGPPESQKRDANFDCFYRWHFLRKEHKWQPNSTFQNLNSIFFQWKYFIAFHYWKVCRVRLEPKSYCFKSPLSNFTQFSILLVRMYSL